MYERLENLRRILLNLKGIVCAFSGGVDSTFLLGVAKDVLSDNNILAVTARAEIFPSHELKEAQKTASYLGVKQIFLDTRQLSNRDFVKNSPKRCYFCKRVLFKKLNEIAKDEKLDYVIDGSNYDDLKDYRPGAQAALELGVISPLQKAKLCKDDIRMLSKEMGLKTWNNPSFTCLATRIPYGDEITAERLERIDRAELFISSKLGIKSVRVRDHGEVARIELAREDIFKLSQPDLTGKIVKKLKRLGYTYIALDLEGYRKGSLNEILKGE